MSFYSHKLQMEKYNLDAEILRPYLQLDKVIDGVFGLAGNSMVSPSRRTRRYP